MENQNLEGKRYINWVRCSTDEQTDTSIPDQLKLLDTFGRENGMVYVDKVDLGGVSGSIPGAHNAIAELIRRKTEWDDFDVLLAQDMTRLTRGGTEHGMKLLCDLETAGIQVIFVADNLPDGDHRGIIQPVGFYVGRQYAKSLSFAVTRGQMSALQQGRMLHCLRVPYGVDRLYIDASGKPLHIIRNLTDGTQQKLDPDTKAVIGVFGRNSKGSRPVHYRQQSGERVVLIPGAPEQVAVVRQIYRWRLGDGWGRYRSAMELNRRGVPAAGGKPWCGSSVVHVLSNPVYTGVGIANMASQGIYHMRSPNAPLPSATDRRFLAEHKRAPRRIRPRADWVETRHPQLDDYLDSDLRPLAKAMHEQILAQRASGIKRISNMDKHVNSPFLLKGILKAKQGGHKMGGRAVGGKQRTRYYGINRTITVPTTDRVMRRLIPAKSLDAAVLDVVRQVLSQADLRPLVEQAIRRQRDRTMADSQELGALMAQREKLKEQFEFAIGNLGELGRELAKEKPGRLELQLRALEARIAKATCAATGGTVDVTKATDAVVGQLVKMGEQLNTLPPAAIRQLLSILISRLEVDLETKNVEIELALPLWAALDERAYADAMCLEQNSFHRAGAEARGETDLLLGVFQCEGRGKPTCFHCTRVRRAA